MAVVEACCSSCAAAEVTSCWLVAAMERLAYIGIELVEVMAAAGTW